MNSAAAKQTMAIGAIFALVAAWFCCALCLAAPGPQCQLSADPSDRSVNPSTPQSCSLACTGNSQSASFAGVTACLANGLPADQSTNHGQEPGPCGDPLSCLLACPVSQSINLIAYQADCFDNLTPRSAYVPAGWLYTGADRQLSCHPALPDNSLSSTGPSHPRPTLISLHTMLTT